MMLSRGLPTTPSRAFVIAAMPDTLQPVRLNHRVPAPWTFGSSRSNHGGCQTRAVLVQAHPRRVAKVSKQIEREIGHIMLTDKVLMDVTQVKSPNGDRRGALCSCSGVHVTNDLQVVKVYMSVLSDDASVKERILSRLSGLSGYVRRRIGERVRLRLTPEIRFLHDEAVERGERVLSLLKKIESGDAYSGTAQTVQDGAVVQSTFSSRAGFWVDTPGGGKSTQAENPKNPFLEGVGDSDYDSDDESAEATFFSADMFPDANPVLDEIAARERQSEWEGQRTQPRYRVKGGRSVRK